MTGRAMKSYSIRWGNADDYGSLAETMFDAIRNGPSKYSEHQRQAWAPSPKSGQDWTKRLTGQNIIVAENEQQLVGFISFIKEGYIDLAFIRPSAQGVGLFSRLYKAIEEHALEHNLCKIRTHASLNAQSAFTAKGFKIVKKETVQLGTVPLDRFEMEKNISQP